MADMLVREGQGLPGALGPGGESASRRASGLPRLPLCPAFCGFSFPVSL